MEMVTINLTVTDDELARINKRVVEGQFDDIDQYLCNLISRELAETLPDQRMERE